MRPSCSFGKLINVNSTIPRKSSLVNLFSSKTCKTNLCSTGFTCQKQFMLVIFMHRTLKECKKVSEENVLFIIYVPRYSTYPKYKFFFPDRIQRFLLSSCKRRVHCLIAIYRVQVQAYIGIARTEDIFLS